MPTCRPRRCGVYQAGSSRKLCRNKTASTFMPRFDLVLRTELCRLSNRHCGKTPRDNQVLFISSALSLNARWLLGRGRSSLNVRQCITGRKMRKTERENELQFRTAERGQVWVTWPVCSEATRVWVNVLDDLSVIGRILKRWRRWWGWLIPDVVIWDSEVVSSQKTRSTRSSLTHQEAYYFGFFLPGVCWEDR